MFCYVKDQFCYLEVHKNASQTHGKLLSDHGWQRRDVFAKDLDLKNMVLWGHISDPEARHTKGIVQYLIKKPDINYHDPSIAKLLVTGVFDTHTYSISMMLGPFWSYPIHWIPLDFTFTDHTTQTFEHLRKKYSSNELTQMWLDENDIDINMDNAVWLTRSGAQEKQMRDTINSYKFQYCHEYKQLVANFLSWDIVQYRKTLDEYAKKFGYLTSIAPVNVYDD
jgi:hypothetical protein